MPHSVRKALGYATSGVPRRLSQQPLVTMRSWIMSDTPNVRVRTTTSGYIPDGNGFKKKANGLKALEHAATCPPLIRRLATKLVEPPIIRWCLLGGKQTSKNSRVVAVLYTPV